MTEMMTTTLFRPVGPEELQLIRRSGFRAFPPRLPEQPIFYPVLNKEHAAPALDLDACNSSIVGLVEIVSAIGRVELGP